MAGLLIEPATAERKSTAIVWIHGGECNFYFLPYVRIGRVLAARGYTFFSGNTRGHDTAAWLWYGTATTGDRYFGGQIWENYEDSPLDIAGWIAFAEQAGFGKIYLAGHSAGAHKVPAYQAQRQDQRVAGLIARVACPILAVLGTNEPDINVEADRTIIREHATSAPRVDTRLIEGADHCYCGQEESVGAVIGDWLDQLAD